MIMIRTILLALALAAPVACSLQAQIVTIDTSPSGLRQVIDGFGAHQGSPDRDQTWWQELYYDDLGASIYRVDLTPRFISPYSDNRYNSPSWGNSGPDGNNVRTYTDASDYTRRFMGHSAPIAVMGPDIERNLHYFTYEPNGAIGAGLARKHALGDFKLVGSLWSPAPWVKVSSGNTYPQSSWAEGPEPGTPWPFIWLGNFAGGRLDVSGTLRPEFDDSSLGGTGPTSALTQFARSTAAYVLGYQRYHDVQFYAISIQNELNFEQFYNSCTYPLSSQYLAALKAVRAAFDEHDDLRDIKIMGPEDLLGGDVWGMWQYGGNQDPIHKNLQYLTDIADDPEAAAALDFFAIHGYDADGVSSSGSDPGLWRWWTNGWAESPHPAIPNNVRGFTDYGKKSWMTETAGEEADWLHPTSGFPNKGAWSIALKIHQALTIGEQSAWIYWTFSEERGGKPTRFALTGRSSGAQSPKYVAAKHYFRYVRPGSRRVEATVTDGGALRASAYLDQDEATLTVVLPNTSAAAATATLEVPSVPGDMTAFDVFTSSENNLWQSSTSRVADGRATVSVPGYGVVTLHVAGTSSTATGEVSVPGPAPAGHAYPNPFDDRSSISYVLERPAHVTVRIYDVRGRAVATIVDAYLAAGEHIATFRADGLPAGTYIGEVRSEGSVRHVMLTVAR